MRPAAGRPLRWGVLAPSAMIARRAVLPALAASPSASVVAVGSVSTDEASGRAACGLDPGVRWHRSYEAVLVDEEVEAVYVPLPNSLHRRYVEAALEAGKHVLCEKPLAVSAADAEAMVAAARTAGRVLLEAYMTPHHPRSQALAAAASFELGEPRFAHTAFTFRMERPGNHRWDAAMGGGALLDVGIYCLAPILGLAGSEPEWVVGRPVAGADPAGVAGSGGSDPVGSAQPVDASFAGLLAFAGGLTASFECSFDAAERQLLELVGSQGAVSVERAFTPGASDTSYRWRHADGRVEERHTGGGEMYSLMVENFAEVVAGRAEPLHPLSATLAIARTVDRLRGAPPGPDDN